MNARAIFAVSSLSLLAACGGGGGSESVSSSGDDEMIADTPVEVVEAATPLVQVLRDEAAGPAALNSNLRSGAAAVTINDDLSVTIKAATGAPFVLSDAQVVMEQDFLRLYRNQDATEVAILANAATGAGDNLLDYTVYGVWLKSFDANATGNDNPALVDMGAYAAGSATPDGALPAAGTATYTGDVVGFERGNFNGAGMLVSGAISLEADFTNRQIEALMQLVDSNGAANGTIVMPATAIAGNGFRSDAATRNSGETGFVEGTFMGPEGREIGGVFQLNGDTDIVGAFGAGVCTQSVCTNTAFD